MQIIRSQRYLRGNDEVAEAMVIYISSSDCRKENVIASAPESRLVLVRVSFIELINILRDGAGLEF